jgi:hypothetical protein
LQALGSGTVDVVDETVEFHELGQRGLSLVQKRVDQFSEMVTIDLGAAGSPTERHWSIDLVKFLAVKVATGVVLGVAPDGGDYRERKNHVRRRFLRRHESGFYIIPSRFHADWSDRMRYNADEERPFVEGGALYWVIQLPAQPEVRLSVLDRTMGLLCPWSPFALIGDDTFDSICEALWARPRASREQLQTLAATTTRILVEGNMGSYLLWEAR